MSDIPLWLRVFVIVVLLVLVAGVIAADIFVADYEGLSTMLTIAGLLGGALGLNEVIRRGGGGDK